MHSGQKPVHYKKWQRSQNTRLTAAIYYHEFFKVFIISLPNSFSLSICDKPRNNHKSCTNWYQFEAKKRTPGKPPSFEKELLLGCFIEPFYYDFVGIEASVCEEQPSLNTVLEKLKWPTLKTWLPSTKLNIGFILSYNLGIKLSKSWFHEASNMQRQSSNRIVNNLQLLHQINNYQCSLSKTNFNFSNLLCMYPKPRVSSTKLKNYYLKYFLEYLSVEQPFFLRLRTVCTDLKHFELMRFSNALHGFFNTIFIPTHTFVGYPSTPPSSAIIFLFLTVFFINFFWKCFGRQKFFLFGRAPAFGHCAHPFASPLYISH